MIDPALWKCCSEEGNAQRCGKTGNEEKEEAVACSRTRKRTTAARTQLFASHGRGRLIKEALVRLSALRPLICMDAMC